MHILSIYKESYAVVPLIYAPPYAKVGFMINAEVVKTGNENNVNLIRRFTKKVQGSGVLPRVRSLRYATRKLSPYVRQKKALKVLKRREEVQELIKLGKMSEHTRGGKK